MDEPRWLLREEVDVIHWELIDEHGGSHGIRDEDAIESALARPRHKWAYQDEVDLPALAAAYGYGLAKNHSLQQSVWKSRYRSMLVGDYERIRNLTG